MRSLKEVAGDIDRILSSGIEILPNSPVHEMLRESLALSELKAKGKYTREGLCAECGTKNIGTVQAGNKISDTVQCYKCRHKFCI